MLNIYKKDVFLCIPWSDNMILVHAAGQGCCMDGLLSLSKFHVVLYCVYNMKFE